MRLSKAQLATLAPVVVACEDAFRGPIAWNRVEGPLTRFSSSMLAVEIRKAVGLALGRKLAAYDGLTVTYAPKTRACGRCGGTGFCPQYAHNGGQCFACR